MPCKILLLILAAVACIYPNAQAQDTTNTHQANGQIAGQVSSAGSNEKLSGVLVELMNFSPRRTTQTDNTGFFEFANVPAGRHRLLFTKQNFEEVLVGDVIVLAGHTMTIEVDIPQHIATLGTPQTSTKSSKSFLLNAKDLPFNIFSNIAARSFTVEEVMRYAGARYDPARLITNFAGVSNFDDYRNDIVIRGNSPIYTQWQIEELPIENPNHFAPLGRSSGAIPILNIMAMGKADFIKGGFSAQYGNVKSGIFDIQLREGNRSEATYLLQVGSQRAEMLLESPLSKKMAVSRRGSFMVAARASIGNILFKNIIPTDPEHQDINFKISFGKYRWGQIELFGIGGRHHLLLRQHTSSLDDKIRYSVYANEDYEHTGYTGVAGMKYTVALNNFLTWRTILGTNYSHVFASYTNNLADDFSEYKIYALKDRRLGFSGHSYMNLSTSKYLHFRLGIFNEVSDFTLRDRYAYVGMDEDIVSKFTLRRWLSRAYLQSRWSVSNQIAVLAGINVMRTDWNRQTAVEPRLSATWKFQPNHSIGAGYSMNHYTAGALDIYRNPKVNDQKDVYPFMRSQIIDLEYNWRFGEYWRLKAQAYYQYADKVWQSADSTSYLSTINNASPFFPSSLGRLRNTGTSINKGVEVSIEKSFSAGYYGLFSATVFDSRYKTPAGEWLNTVFNNQFIVNFLTGKEFKFGNFKQHMFFVDVKFSVIGGRPYVPIDAETTYLYGGFQTIYVDSSAYRVRTPVFKQVDVKLGCRLNGKKGKLSHLIRADLFNVLNIKNVFTYQYSQVYALDDQQQQQQQQGTITPIYQRGFIPDITYSILF